VRLHREGIVLKRLDAPYTPGVRTDAWRKVKTAAWCTDHGPRRLPKEVRERVHG
jgi:ATP-dependent DNA ligase